MYHHERTQIEMCKCSEKGVSWKYEYSFAFVTMNGKRMLASGSSVHPFVTHTRSSLFGGESK